MRVVTVSHKGKPSSRFTVYTAARAGKYHQHITHACQTRHPEVAISITSTLVKEQKCVLQWKSHNEEMFDLKPLYVWIHFTQIYEVPEFSSV